MELAGVSVDARQVERSAEALRAEIVTDEKQNTEPLEDAPRPSTLYLGVDGTGIPMRLRSCRGRRGKQPDVKCQNARSETMHDLERGSTRCAAAAGARPGIDHLHGGHRKRSQCRDRCGPAFTQRVLREATRRRFTQAEETVVLGDGAPWIWNIARELFPRAIQIVDRFHAKQHLGDVSKALYGDSTAARNWAQRRHRGPRPR
jgi:hypothetical protein